MPKYNKIEYKLLLPQIIKTEIKNSIEILNNNIFIIKDDDTNSTLFYTINNNELNLIDKYKNNLIISFDKKNLIEINDNNLIIYSFDINRLNKIDELNIKSSYIVEPLMIENNNEICKIISQSKKYLNEIIYYKQSNKYTIRQITSYYAKLKVVSEKYNLLIINGI